MSTDPEYRRVVIIDRHAKNERGFTPEQVRRADLIIGKDQKVIKDRFGVEGGKMPLGDIKAICANAEEVIGVVPEG